jgi:P-type Na+/K+ transporter
MASPTGRVIRAGHSHVVPSLTIVPGDMLELRVGDTVPADVRLIECMNFETDEALLTGESLPVQKDVNVTFSSEKESTEEIAVPVGDRLNMAYSSSTVTKGRARGIVTGTGMSTEIGSIAKSLSSSGTGRVLKRNSDGKVTIQQYVRFGALRTWDKFGKFLGINVGTPLQRKLSLLAILLFGVAVVFAIIVMAANKFSSAQPVILYAVGYVSFSGCLFSHLIFNILAPVFL